MFMLLHPYLPFYLRHLLLHHLVVLSYLRYDLDVLLVEGIDVNLITWLLAVWIHKVYYGCTVAISCLLFLAAFSWGQMIKIPSNLCVGGGTVSAAAGAASDALSLPDANVPPGYFIWPSQFRWKCKCFLPCSLFKVCVSTISRSAYLCVPLYKPSYSLSLNLYPRIAAKKC